MNFGCVSSAVQGALRYATESALTYPSEEQSQSAQRRRATAMQAEGQAGAAQAGGQKEKMRQEMAPEIDGAAVLQA